MSDERFRRSRRARQRLLAAPGAANGCSGSTRADSRAACMLARTRYELKAQRFDFTVPPAQGGAPLRPVPRQAPPAPRRDAPGRRRECACASAACARAAAASACAASARAGACSSNRVWRAFEMRAASSRASCSPWTLRASSLADSAAPLVHVAFGADCRDLAGRGTDRGKLGIAIGTQRVGLLLRGAERGELGIAIGTQRVGLLLPRRASAASWASRLARSASACSCAARSASFGASRSARTASACSRSRCSASR